LLLALLVLASICAPSALAQPQLRLDTQPKLSEALQEMWRWTNFGERDGLPSNIVSQVVETEDGTIWANTGSGLAWYDDFQWHPIPCQAFQKGRSPRQIQSLGTSSVIGTGEGMPVLFERTSCKPIQLKFEGKPLTITSSGRKSDGIVIVQDSNLNYYTWNGSSDQVQAKVFDGPQNLASRLSVSAGAPLFLSSRAGLIRLDNKGTTTFLDANKLKDPAHIAGLFVRASADNRKGSGIISIAFPQDWIGLWEWSKDGDFRQMPQSRGQVARQLAISDRGDAIAVYNSTEAWLKEDGKWAQLRPIPAPLRVSNSLYFDRQGRLWVSTSSGLHLLRSGQSIWSRLQFPFPNLNNHFLSLLSTQDGNLWAGTNDGILVISPDGSVKHTTHIGSQRLGLVTGLAQQRDGSIWCSSGASFGGAFRFSNGKWQRFGPAEGLPNAPMHRVQVDAFDRLWVLGSAGGLGIQPSGAFAFDGKNFDRWDKQRGLIDSRVYSMASGIDGALWFTTFQGISRYKDKAWTHWSQKQGLAYGSIFFVLPQTNGAAYFLDRRNGLGQIGLDGKVSYHTLGKSPPAQATWELREDPKGILWLSTRGGLMLRREGEWSNIGPSAGLENPEIWPIAFWRNHICTGSDGSGLYCLSREALNRPVPRLVVLPPKINGSSAILDWRVFGFGESSSGDGHLARFRLDSGPWSDWLSTGTITISDLTHGRHSLHFEAKDQFGTKAKPIKDLSFDVPAPLLQQPAFFVPVGISLVAALLAVYAFIHRTYQHNRKLAEKEESFRALIEYSSVGITLWDHNRRVFYASPALRIILGYEPQELLGDFNPDLIHPDDLPTVQARLKGLIEVAGQTQRSRVRMKHKNGEYRWIEVISRNLFDNPAVGAIVTNMRDITDSTNAEIATAEARQRAESANQAKSDFLAMISHEIRTPMNGITGMCQLLLESNLNKEQQDYSETIAQSAQSLLALINDVLDFSRIEAGKLSIERAPIDLSLVLSEVVQLMRVRAEEKGLKIKTTYPADAPRAFYGDALRIRQILFNLTGNAVKFTDKGNISLDAEIKFFAASRYSISISVRDTGIGIDPEKLETVFHKFTQADLSTTRRYGGTGLGLSISRSLAELMGGTIVAQSTPGEGSEFRLEIQLDVAPENALERRESSVNALQPLPESLDILLVEDNKVNQKLALRLLERLGCQAKVAASGLEALAMLEKYDFDLILMDCQMPEMDGYEATRRIREREHGTRHIPIVAITANAMESDLERCLTSGMDSYLTKPIDFAKLRDALETWGIDYRAPRATSDPGAS
jgi:PAS domain S-box-containing protein